MQRKSNKPQPPPHNRGRPRNLRSLSAAVVGLNGIGRQVALLLVASGIRSLLLVDHRTVIRRSQRIEGYDLDDIGRLKAHAAAQACHEIDPGMEVVTQTRRSDPDLSGNDVIFICGVSDRHITGQSKPTAWVHVLHDVAGYTSIRVECRTAGNLAAPQSFRKQPQPAIATIMAGLAVDEYGRLLAGDRASGCTRRVKLREVTINVSVSARN